MKRTVIKIDENLCNGCGNCINGCHEGALELIDGKAVMISDLYCDGLGACIGECPTGAISFEERDAAPYDEVAVMERLTPKGEAAILAHLRHLKDHGETEWVKEGVKYLKKHNIQNIDLAKIGLGYNGEQPEAEPRAARSCPSGMPQAASLACGCPGSVMREIGRPQSGFTVATTTNSGAAVNQPSELRQFPVQLHLINPRAGFLANADLLLAADCTAFASGEFHLKFLKGKILAIACPKLDSNTETYVAKLTEMIDIPKISTLTVLIMDVPCCGGLMRIAQLARDKAQRNVPVKVIVLGVDGETKSEEWI